MWIAFNWALMMLGLFLCWIFSRRDTLGGVVSGFSGVIVLFIGMTSSLLAWLHLN